MTPEEKKEVIDNVLSQISTVSVSEESERLGVDIVDVVNKNFWNLIEIENEEK